ncbi:MAG TPA: Asp-tRNA(Asn)/Glu-tRNA(Gln) amidotransferase subunit GatB [Nanoarchaeota archaeon]|nr:Asp-tRNA(Asn)/Glu-tRNA(Gln) amidotransferase subunit GatB [Nanoarchaeota archaeon]
MKVKIGLETHVQLATKTKLFCSCSIENLSEAEPNTRVCDICLGFPGSKPVLNKKAVDIGIKIALALNCKIHREFFFSRKSYFYPDMAKNFQISQYEIPLASNGYLIVNGKKIRIKRVHLEEDPARIIHVGKSITEAKYTLLDYNRSGIPLVEIVTEPDIESPKEAREYLKTLMLILEYLGVFDPKEHLMKSDANISLEGGERVEIKNITGFREVENALNFEILRHKNLLKRGIKPERETRMWDPVTKTTKSLRKKEEEEEYGYIFEPDLVKIVLTEEQINAIKQSLPEMPQEKFEKYLSMGLNKEIAFTISSDLQLAIFFESLLDEFSPNQIDSWILVLKKILNYNDVLLSETKLKKEHFSLLVKKALSGEISDRAFELILREVVFYPEKLEMLLKEYQKISGEKLKEIVLKVIENNKKAVEDYKSGEEKALNYLVGQVMKEIKGKGDAKEIRKIILELLNG